ncbi:MAG: excinuclease ABC subunit UvrC [Chloroflexota bacterium]
MTEKLANKLDNLPDKPGCYQMMDQNGTVIYVGKAVVLKNRVRSYFHAAAQKDTKTRLLVEDIVDISWWVTETELEALILENELIKRYKPRYNIRLKDDRQFPYIKIHWQEDFPKVSVVRKMTRDGARYFGPYASSRACYQTLDALRRVFPYLDCERQITGQDHRPCLYYHIKLCGAPCIGKQNRDEYREIIQQLMDFLHGKSDHVVTRMESQMEQAAENLQFELAALYRDRLKAAQRIVEQQKIISATMEDADYIAVAQDERTADVAVQVFIVRNGRLIGRENYMLEGAILDETNKAPSSEESKGSVLDHETERPLALPNTEHTGQLICTFIQQFYDHAVYIPKLILVQALPLDESTSRLDDSTRSEAPEGKTLKSELDSTDRTVTEDDRGVLSSTSTVQVLEAWLSKKRGTNVELRVPRRGAKREFMELAQRNAAEYLRVQQAEWAADTNRQTEAVAELQDVLKLERPPSRIECFDISTLQGTNTVGSMVVFGKGAPLKSAYKRFKIRGKGAQGEPDDFASMREMLRRRFRRIIEDESNPDPGQKGRPVDENWRILPELVIIDGGKGQLGIAVEVLKEFDLYGRIPVVGLAKQEEEIFRPNISQSFWLKRGSASLHLVQRIRDEAHRFAITYHRRLRSKDQTRSKLDDVPGIGPTRRRALLQHFGGDIEKIRQSSLDALLAVPGMTRASAQSIKENL